MWARQQCYRFIEVSETTLIDTVYVYCFLFTSQNIMNQCLASSIVSFIPSGLYRAELFFQIATEKSLALRDSVATILYIINGV